MLQSTPDSSNWLLTATTLAFIAIAVKRSQRMWRTLFYLLGMMLLAGAIGTAIGWLKGPATAAVFAVLLAQMAGIAASIARIIRAKKDERAKT